MAQGRERRIRLTNARLVAAAELRGTGAGPESGLENAPGYS